MSQGFTLIEVLLSVAIISLLMGLSVPVYATFQTRNDLELNTQSVAEMFRRASTYARGNNGDSQWGVATTSSTATLFKGATYATRDATYDETVTMPSSLAITGLTQVIFSKLAATPSPTGTVTLTAAQTNDVRTITLNAKGMVAY